MQIIGLSSLILKESCIKHNMQINAGKTEAMAISREHKTHHLNDKVLKEVEEFKYSGNIFTIDRRINREVENSPTHQQFKLLTDTNLEAHINPSGDHRADHKLIINS